jgi:hypothetical protein
MGTPLKASAFMASLLSVFQFNKGGDTAASGPRNFRRKSPLLDKLPLFR